MGESDEVLDAYEAAAYLKINEQTVRRLARAREIPAFRVGGVWRFRKAALRAWASEQHVEPMAGGPVLIVDDDPFVRSVLERTLAREGFEPHCASSGEEALAMMPLVRPELVLLDLAMPGMDGVAVLRRLRAEWEHVPVVILTGYPDSDLVTRALDFSPITLLAKPFTIDKLFETIRLIRRPRRPSEDAGPRSGAVSGGTP